MKRIHLNIQRFAYGEYEFTTVNHMQGRITFSGTSNGSAANSSNVLVVLWVRKDSYSSTPTTGKQWKGSITIDGTTSSFTSLSTSVSVLHEWVQLFSYTKTVPHNADGTKTITLSGSVTGPTGTSLANTTSSGTTSFILDTIPLSSQPTSNYSQATLGSTSLTISTNRASSSFSHTITTSINGVGIETFYSVGDSKQFTPSIALYAPYITTSSANCVITCYTYQNGVQIGSPKSCNVTFIVPSSVKPSITSITAVESNQNIVEKGWNLDAEQKYIQNLSRIAITINADGIYNSTIKKYSTSVADLYSNSNRIFTTNPLTLSGNRKIKSTVTDTRDATAYLEKDYECIEYSQPTITNVKAERCLSNGTPSDEGTYLKYTFIGSVSPINNGTEDLNSHEYKLGYKLSTDSTYTYITLTGSGYNINSENIVLLGTTFPAENKYDIRFMINDEFYSTVIDAQLGTGSDLINFNASGKSMALGKVSEASSTEKVLEVDFDETHIYGDVYLNNNKLFDLIYPIGSIYLSTVYFNPGTIFGGTWESILDRFLLASGNIYGAGTTGGEASHTLTQSELPNYNLAGLKWWNGDPITLDGGTYGSGYKLDYTYHEHSATQVTGLQMNSGGGGQAHNNMPPYLVVYMWKRTA